MTPSETQLTAAPHGHIITNTAVWSPDSQWIVYDVRSDAAGTVFDGTRIERVHVSSKQVEVLYSSKNGACVGVATVNPVDGRVVFIHGPEHPTPDWTYSMCHREGVIVDPSRPGVGIPLEARDLVPPFTNGALRGGTHVHTWDSKGKNVSFTYEDHLLTHGTAPGREPNRRTIGVSMPNESGVIVPQIHSRNRNGSHFSSIVAATIPKPTPGTDEIGRAFEDGWIPNQNRMTFIGEVVAAGGRKVNELFLLEGFEQEHLESSNESELAMPLPAKGMKQTRLTYFAQIPGHTGLTTLPRHWPRASPDGKRAACLTENGILHLIDLEIKNLSVPFKPKPVNLTFSGRHLQDQTTQPTDLRISSTFSWHPNGKYLVAVIHGSVCLIEVESGIIRPLTESSNPPPRPEACVVSPAGKKVAFVRQVIGINQIFVVDVP